MTSLAEIGTLLGARCHPCRISFPHEGYRDDSCWKCGHCYVLLYSCGDYQTLLTNLFLPSCILALMVLLLPWFAEEREAGAQCAHTITLPGGITHVRAGLAKGGEGQTAQSTGPDFCKSQENWHQIQTRPLSSATLSRKSYAIPNTEHFAEKKK